MASIVLISQNLKRGVLFEKFNTPHWLFEIDNLHYPIHYIDKEQLYKYILRILNGDEVTISFQSEAYINKYGILPEILPYGVADFLINQGIIGHDSGNDIEEHYNIYSI